MLKNVAIYLGIMIVAGYSYVALKDIVRGPKIVVVTPENGYATTTPLIVVTGQIQRAVILALNGATTTTDLAGNFKESLLLSPGYNIMTLEARDRYGRVVKEIIEMTLSVVATGTPALATSTAEIIL